MPASILQGIAEAILQPILEVGCYYVGRVIVPIVSLGRLKCDLIMADTPRQKIRGGGLFHRRGQQIYLTADATAGVGIIFIILVAVGYVIYHLSA